MAISYGGSIFFKRGLIFSDNKADLKHSHPTFNLITTDENDEYAYLLPMTSDNNRVRDHKDIYTPVMINKKSFLNLSHIIEVENKIRPRFEIVDPIEYKELLEKFYRYQINHPGDKKFEKIRNRVETLIQMLNNSHDNKKLMEFYINNTYLQKYLSSNKVMDGKTKQIAFDAVAQINLGENITSGGTKSENLKKKTR